MRPANPELHTTTTVRRTGSAPRRPTGDHRGDQDVSPVSSDATGVRENGGGRGREDATRPPRRYITYCLGRSSAASAGPASWGVQQALDCCHSVHLTGLLHQLSDLVRPFDLAAQVDDTVLDVHVGGALRGILGLEDLALDPIGQRLVVRGRRGLALRLLGAAANHRQDAVTRAEAPAPT